jgi:protoporphyrinogen oxidase
MRIEGHPAGIESMDKRKILILGAGPTGLGAAWRLGALGHGDWELWEREAVPGGLSRSVVDDHGFTWDLGGHVQFSHYKTFDDLMDRALGADGWLSHQRESWVRIFKAWVPYPLQYNIHRLPPEQTLRCLKGLQAAARERRDDRPFEHFEDLIRRCFGEGLAEIFMLPYNFKAWGYPPREMGTGWIGERVAMPDLDRVLESVALGKDDRAWGPNNAFRFPKRGGTGAIWRAVAAGLPQEKLKLGRRATRIDARQRVAYAEDGTACPYDALISSAPLDELVEMAGLDDLRKTTGGLKFSTVHVVGVGLEGRPGPELATKCWMYFPEPDCPFYRVTVFSNYSPANVPDAGRYWSLMAEVAESPSKPVHRARLAEDVVQGMSATGLIERREQVHHAWTFTIARGYPTPALGRDAILERALPELERMGIYSRGRFGAWKYEVSNQDHSLMQGVEAVDRILRGTEERTLWRPDEVNNPRPLLGKTRF